MSEKIDISTLPEDIQAQIRESKREIPPLFPIQPREYVHGGFQTKEQREMAEKIDLLIEAVNTLHTKSEDRNENTRNGK